MTDLGERLLARPEVCAKVGLKQATLYKLIGRGEFPKPVQISGNRVGWLMSEVDAWIRERVEARAA